MEYINCYKGSIEQNIHLLNDDKDVFYNTDKLQKLYNKLKETKSAEKFLSALLVLNPFVQSGNISDKVQSMNPNTPMTPEQINELTKKITQDRQSIQNFVQEMKNKAIQKNGGVTPSIPNTQTPNIPKGPDINTIPEAISGTINGLQDILYYLQNPIEIIKIFSQVVVDLSFVACAVVCIISLSMFVFSGCKDKSSLKYCGLSIMIYYVVVTILTQILTSF